MNTIALKKTLVRWQVKETALILSASVMLPFLIHLIPPIGGIPFGARLLAMFYAPFIAVMLFKPHVAIITGLFSPILNSLLTGYPAPEIVGVLSVELVVFCLVAYLIRRRAKNFRGTAALAYLIALLVVTCAAGASDAFFLRTVFNALPGIAMLVLMNILLLRSPAK